MGPATAVLIGAGNRGRFTYGDFALRHPHALRLVALAEPDAEKRRRTADDHDIPESACFESFEALFDAAPEADGAIVATSDTLHVDPTLRALDAGHHVLLEKPIAPSPEDCLRVVEAAERAGRFLQIGHVLRYTPFYQRAMEIARGGELGELVHLELAEHVAAWHMAHSFVRGKFRNHAVAAPLLLAKACHDLDLLVWLAGREVERVSSFGALVHFRPGSAPPGAPPRCSDGCPEQERCPHDACAFYLAPDEELARAWPWADLGGDPSRAARERALREGRYGRCVYRCDNDVVDHQTVSLALEGGATASFLVQGLAPEERRTLRWVGSRGELRGDLHGGWLEVRRLGALGVERVELPASPLGHFGGDEALTAHFAEALRSGDGAEVRTSGRTSLESHWIGFAAEEARREGRVVTMDAFRAAVRERAAG